MENDKLNKNNSKVIQLIKQERFQTLQYILNQDNCKDLTKEDIYEIYKYVFLVTEKANSMCEAIDIPLENIFNFLNMISKLLNEKDVDFEQLAIKQYGNIYEFINDSGQILYTYNPNNLDINTNMQLFNNEFSYQPSNLEYVRENIKYRQNRIKQMLKIKDEIPNIFLENEQLFYEKAKQRLETMINGITLRNNEKMKGMENMKNLLNENQKKEMKEKIIDDINLLKDVSDELKSDKQFILDIVEGYYDHYHINDYCEEKICEVLRQTIPDSLFSDEEMVLKLIDIFVTVYLETKMTDHHFIDITSTKMYKFLIEKMDSNLRNNKEFIKKLGLGSISMLFLSEELKTNKEFMLEKIKESPENYECMNKEFKIDDDIITLLKEVINGIPEEEKGWENDFETILDESGIFSDQEIMNYIRTEEPKKQNPIFMELYKSIIQKRIGNLIQSTNKIVTHYGDDLDNKAAIYAIQKWAEDNDYIKIGYPIEIVRVPAGQVKECFLNVDTGGHKGSKIDSSVEIIIDGNPEKGVKSASEALSNFGIYVPEQIIELADTRTNKVSSLDSRSSLALIRDLTGEQIFKLAEKGLLDKSLTDEQLGEFGLTKAHKKQERIINLAIEEINKYTKKINDEEKIVLAPEPILAGSSIAYEKGINYYVSAACHFDENGKSDGVTFAITSKPGIKLPEEVIKFGKDLEEKYRIDENTSGVFVNSNGQMIVAGGLKNPDFKIENETVDGILEIIENKFTGKYLSKDEEIIA